MECSRVCLCPKVGLHYVHRPPKHCVVRTPLAPPSCLPQPGLSAPPCLYVFCSAIPPKASFPSGGAQALWPRLRGRIIQITWDVPILETIWQSGHDFVRSETCSMDMSDTI